MDNDVLNYLNERKVIREFVEDNHAFLYKQSIIEFCSCTVMTQVTWGMIPVSIGDEQHYDEL